jgi:hypothetical protein
MDDQETDIAIGRSGFRIKSKVVIDLSAQHGWTANPGGAGTEWAGLHFGKAKIVPNLFGLAEESFHTQEVNDWGVVGNSLVGKVVFAEPFSKLVGEGEIRFASIHAEAKQGDFDASYKNMDVTVPWLTTHMKGDGLLISGEAGKEAYLDFRGLAANDVTKSYGPVSLTARGLIFGSYEGIGWGVWTESTVFSFKAENVSFAKDVTVPGLIFGMDGNPHLVGADGTDLSLGGKSSLGKTPITLTSVRIGLPADEQGVLDFDFATQFSISEVMAAVDVPVEYSITRMGTNYFADGPRVAPFDLDVSFPAGQPRVSAKVHIEYTGEGLGSSTAGADPSRMLATRGIAWDGEYPPETMLLADASGTTNDRFNGTLDMSMFDGPPVKAEFRLGYMGGHDYWIMRATLDLGNGITFIPPILSLYQIRGGLGHNFPLDAFQSTGSLGAIQPTIDGSYVFMAGLRVGTPDKFICMLDGDLSIKLGEGARLDFRSWLVTHQHTGEGNFKGYLQYAADGFDGALSGRFNFLGDAVYMEIPPGACTMHFGSDSWHIYAGKVEGPRLNMYMLFVNVNGYLMLDSNGLQTGGGMNYYLGCSIGHITGFLETGLALYTDPRIEGHASGGFRAEVCAYDVCIGCGINAGVAIGALPISARAHACIEIPIPFWNPEVCANFSI